MQKTSNNISFKSNIHFVDSKTFDKLKKGLHITMNNMMGFDTDIWTKEVRTCTGGGLVSDEGVIGFHIFDEAENLLNSKTIAKNISSKIKDCKNGLMMGSKTYENYVGEFSVAIFKSIKEELSKFCKNLSFFEEHKKTFGQTHLHYSKDEDTW